MKPAWIGLFVAAMALSGCSTLRDEVRGWSKSVVENAAEQRWEFTLTNLTDRPLCFSSASWPDSRGDIGASGRLYLEVGGENIYIEPLIGTTGRVRLDPHQSATAFGRFDNFDQIDWDNPPEYTLHWSMLRESCVSDPDYDRYEPSQNITRIGWGRFVNPRTGI